MKRITEGIPVDETLPDCPQSAKKKPSPWKAVGTIAACLAAVLICVAVVRNQTSLSHAVQTAAEASVTAAHAGNDARTSAAAQQADAASTKAKSTTAAARAAAAITTTTRAAKTTTAATRAAATITTTTRAAVTTTRITTTCAATTTTMPTTYASTTQHVGFPHTEVSTMAPPSAVSTPYIPITMTEPYTVHENACITSVSRSGLFQLHVRNVLNGNSYTVSDGTYTVSYQNGDIVVRDSAGNVLYADDADQRQSTLNAVKSTILGLTYGYKLTELSSDQETYVSSDGRTMQIYYSSGNMEHVTIDGTYYAYSVTPSA